jgi:hypothetical protein
VLDEGSSPAHQFLTLTLGIWSCTSTRPCSLEAPFCMCRRDTYLICGARAKSAGAVPLLPFFNTLRLPSAQRWCPLHNCVGIRKAPERTAALAALHTQRIEIKVADGGERCRHSNTYNKGLVIHRHGLACPTLKSMEASPSLALSAPNAYTAQPKRDTGAVTSTPRSPHLLQELHHVIVAHVACKVPGPVASIVAGVDLGAQVEQQLTAAQVEDLKTKVRRGSARSPGV